MISQVLSPNRIGRSGQLKLEFERREGRTVMAEHFSRPPLQVMRAIPDMNGSLSVYLLSPTGGVVQGDEYSIHVRAGAQTHVIFTTQSATKIYRMPNGCAEQTTRMDVERGAFIEYLPDATILFADADYRQHTEAWLDPGALLLFQDVVMPGRLARGECLQFRRFDSRLVARRSNDHGLLLFEAASLDPARDALSALGRLEGYPCWGTAYLIGDPAAWKLDSPALIAEFTPLTGHEHLPPSDGLAGISALVEGGICLRIVARRLETIYELLRAFRDLVRLRALGLAAAPLRK